MRLLISDRSSLNSSFFFASKEENRFFVRELSKITKEYKKKKKEGKSFRHNMRIEIWHEGKKTLIVLNMQKVGIVLMTGQGASNLRNMIVDGRKQSILP